MSLIYLRRVEDCLFCRDCRKQEEGPRPQLVLSCKTEEEVLLTVSECLVECSPIDFLSTEYHSKRLNNKTTDRRRWVLWDWTVWGLDSIDGLEEDSWQCRYLGLGLFFSLLWTGHSHCYHRTAQTWSFNAWRKDFRHSHSRNRNKIDPSQMKIEKPIHQEARRTLLLHMRRFQWVLVAMRFRVE